MKLVQGLANDLEAALDRRLFLDVADSGSQTHTFDKACDLLSDLVNILQQDPVITLNRQPRAIR